MKTENVNKFNSLMNHLSSYKYVTIKEFYELAELQGYDDKDIILLLQHLLKSKQFIQYEGRIFVKKGSTINK